MRSSYVQFVIPKATTSCTVSSLRTLSPSKPPNKDNPFEKRPRIPPLLGTAAPSVSRTARQPGLKCNLLECVSHEILAPNLHCFPTINISCSLKQRFVSNGFYISIRVGCCILHTSTAGGESTNRFQIRWN